MNNFESPNLIARETQVTRQMTLADKVISELIEQINALEARLAPVLRDEDKIKADSPETQKSERLVQLAASLASKVDLISQQVNRIQALRNRIEI